MHYIPEAGESAVQDEAQSTSAATDCDAIKFNPPCWRVAKGNPPLGESSFDLHDGLDVSDDQIDTIPVELLAELFKR